MSSWALLHDCRNLPAIIDMGRPAAEFLPKTVLQVFNASAWLTPGAATPCRVAEFCCWK